MSYEAIYDSMVRVDESRYVHDKHVRFDVDAIDEVLSDIVSDGFIAIKEVTTFALFPICGQAWNHYLLESFCYRYSKRYTLHVVGSMIEMRVSLPKGNSLVRMRSFLQRLLQEQKSNWNPRKLEHTFLKPVIWGSVSLHGLTALLKKPLQLERNNKPCIHILLIKRLAGLS